MPDRSFVPFWIDVAFDVATPFIALVALFLLWRSEVRDRLEAAVDAQVRIAREDELRRLRT